jgi:hypothetical protein
MQLQINVSPKEFTETKVHRNGFTSSRIPVVECTVVISPSKIPNLSLITLARGARQLVVQLALETMSSLVYLSSLTPMTNMGASLLGAEITTFLAPPCKNHHSLVKIQK